MVEIIDMPKLSDTMTVGTIVHWLKQEGDVVSIGDMLCEIETDKATMELENLVMDGVLLKLYIAESGEAPIGSPICAIGEAGETAPALEVPKKNSSPEVLPEPEGVSPPKPTVTQEDPEMPPEPKPVREAPLEEVGQRIKSSPLARKLAEEKNIPIETIQPSGPGGRILKKDVLAAAEKGFSPPESLAPEPVSVGSVIVEPAQIKLSNMRKAIAARLLESKTQIPHFYLETEVDAAALMATRSALNEDLAALPPDQGGIKLTINDFILKASAEALRRVPEVNASWMGDHIQQHGRVHMAFGVAVPDGLLTPVIWDAHAKTLRQISAEAKQLIGKARDKKLKPEEMSGSTFTVTNLGMFGVTGFYGIINPPNAAILSVGATVAKPVVAPNGEIRAGHRMAMSLSGDHRVIDGAAGARFLQALKTLLETPPLMLA